MDAQESTGGNGPFIDPGDFRHVWAFVEGCRERSRRYGGTGSAIAASGGLKVTLVSEVTLAQRPVSALVQNERLLRVRKLRRLHRLPLLPSLRKKPENSTQKSSS